MGTSTERVFVRSEASWGGALSAGGQAGIRVLYQTNRFPVLRIRHLIVYIFLELSLISQVIFVILELKLLD
jgi:hypothetical protein